MELDPRISSRLENTRETLAATDSLLPHKRLAACYALFRERFGPQSLQSLSGVALLETMHLHANHDSLVYWLEFKDDEEFPARFGSIAGGSALKFGIYRRKETGIWMTGHAKAQKELTTDQAIAVAERHREQLVAGSRALDTLPTGAREADYIHVQRQLEEVAPDVQDMSWGHKYFSLMHPDLIDDFHTVDFQHFHLIKCLQAPPQDRGRYLAARQFVEIAEAFNLPLNHLTTVLNRANGRPRNAWRIGTRVSVDGVDNVLVWPQMKALGVAAIGWDVLGDLSGVEGGQPGKGKLAQRLQDVGYYKTAAHVASRKAGEILNFVTVMQDGDLVVAADGENVLGVGTVLGPYHHSDETLPGAPHRRPVAWLDTSKWRLPDAREGLLTTFRVLDKDENLIALERKLLNPQVDKSQGEEQQVEAPPNAKPGALRAAIRLTGIQGQIQDVLERKYQAIVYGPPGTGKTHWAVRTAKDLAAAAAFGRLYADLDVVEEAEIDGHEGAGGLVRTCTFHPGYGYEDFLEGFRPATSAAQQLTFTLRAGLFKSLCSDAAAEKDREFFLVIDEINRGDIPRIFGELITLLERDKRGRFLHLPVSGERFAVPGNVRIIGTMNTADRSIALLDTALRRRFGFVELLPDHTTLADAVVGGVPLGAWLQAVNAVVRAHVGRDARNLQIGHAFLLEGEKPVTDPAKFARIVAEDIVPLLEEYCYEDYVKLEKILGKGLVDVAGQRVRSELFGPARIDDLMLALLQPFTDIVTTRDATIHEEESPTLEDAEDSVDETAP